MDSPRPTLDVLRVLCAVGDWSPQSNWHAGHGDRLDAHSRRVHGRLSVIADAWAELDRDIVRRTASAPTKQPERQWSADRIASVVLTHLAANCDQEFSANHLSFATGVPYEKLRRVLPLMLLRRRLIGVRKTRCNGWVMYYRSKP